MARGAERGVPKGFFPYKLPPPRNYFAPRCRFGYSHLQQLRLQDASEKLLLHGLSKGTRHQLWKGHTLSPGMGTPCLGGGPFGAPYRVGARHELIQKIQPAEKSHQALLPREVPGTSGIPRRPAGRRACRNGGETPPPTPVGNRWPLLPPAGPAHGQDVVGVGAGGHGTVEVAEVLAQQLAQGAAAHQAGCGRLLGQLRQQEQVFPSLQRHPARLRGRGGGRGGGRSPAVSISPPPCLPLPPLPGFCTAPPRR